MYAQLKHLAISSSNNARLVEFYEALFGLRKDRSIVVSDGYIGMNLNPRGIGRQAGLDHFGFEVEDVESIYAKLRDDYPDIEVAKRPSNRPFAGISTHDPAGNVFDLSQPGMENRKGLYAESPDDWLPRHISHVMLRAVKPEPLATFYRDVFHLQELPRAAEDPRHYLTDGRVQLIIAPWKITDFAGTGIERPAMDHIGFHVESVEAFREDLQRLMTDRPDLFPQQRRQTPEEGDTRLKLLAGCSHGQFCLADPDGVLLDVSEA
jgi:catechol 2,3-dioxygenase-like lactoylglutathione lyase family enzyme